MLCVSLYFFWLEFDFLALVPFVLLSIKDDEYWSLHLRLSLLGRN